MNETGSISSKKAEREKATTLRDMWAKELDASGKRLKKFHEKGTKIDQRYRADNKADEKSSFSRLNLFHSNTKTLLNMLYGSVPKVEVSRKYADSNDDVARVAATILERMINCELEVNGAEIDHVLKSVVQDRLLPGMGVARVRYEVDITTTAIINEAGEEEEQDEFNGEYSLVEYYYWKDVLWGWGRSFIKLPWIAFRTYIDKDKFEKRFPKAKIAEVNFKPQQVVETDTGGDDNPDHKDVVEKTEVWEIWDKSTKKVLWFSKDCSTLLDQQDDPLGLEGFYPCPPFFMANATTTEYIATADFKICEDMYNKIDILQTRIDKITEAVRVTGVYDQKNDKIKDMLAANWDGKLIPVERWAMFAEGGGIAGAVDWFPIKEVVEALNELIKARDDEIGLLQQISGMSDVMRGQLDNQYEGVGQTKEKAKFGSIRIQALQEEFARFASDLMQLKVEVISKHFDPKTIIKMSNMMFSLDKDKLIPATMLIKSPDMKLRVKIQPENLAMTDFAQMQADRSNFLKGMSQFLKAASPLMQEKPETASFMLEMLKWTMAAFKGSNEIEGVMDKAIDAVKAQAAKDAANPKPDPNEIKAQTEIQKIEQKKQADLEIREADRRADIETIQAQTEADKLKIAMDTQSDLAIIAAKMEAKIREEFETSQANLEQNLQGIAGEMRKNLQEFQLSVLEMIKGAELDMTTEKHRASVKQEEAENGESIKEDD